jgi:hypothetical protein
MSTQQKEAMSRHFIRMAREPEYKKECTQERNSAFLSTDVNLNGILDLDEWICFCKKQVGNISRRVGVELIPADEEHMTIQWKINQFEGKGGISPNDFKKKALIDMKLMGKRV